MRLVRFVAALIGFVPLGVFCAGRTAKPAVENVAPSVLPHASSALPQVAPRLVHDRLYIQASAQAGDGSVWAVGYDQFNICLFLWSEDNWRKVEVATDWPGEVLEMHASPVSAGVVYSIWGGPPRTSGSLNLLHVWRHEAGAPSRKVASFANPTAQAGKSSGERPRISIDAVGDVWLAFPNATLMCVPASGGEPKIVPVDPSLFATEAGRSVSTIRPVGYMPESAVRGWLWTVQDVYRSTGEGELFRPACVVAGRVTASPEIAGLPGKGCVTWISRPRDGRMVWAIEGAGLWEIDLATLSAKPRSSPPTTGRILEWSVVSDDLEVALVYEHPGDRRDQLRGEVWVRYAGKWSNAGPSGDTFGGVRLHDWQQWDGVLLGSGFRSGMVQVDYSADRPIARNLDWLDHITMKQPQSMHRLRDGRLLTTGKGWFVAEAGALRNRWNARSPQVVWTVPEHPVRAEDGRLWFLVASGRGAPCVRHWDGGAWHEWPLPEERAHWSVDNLWVDECGRVAVLSDGLDKPAWERDENAPGAWRRWGSGRELVTARATELKPVASLYPLSEGLRTVPVLGQNGGALVRAGAFWHLSGGVWTSYDQRALGTTPFRYGFDEDGRPWFHANGTKRSLIDGVWVEAGKMNDSQSRMTHASVPWPEWLKAGVDVARATAAHRDAEGVWWVLQDGELWKGRDGEVARVFPDDEPSPFRSGMSFYGVKADASGNRLFDCGTQVLLRTFPGPAVQARVAPEALLVDRTLVVSGTAELLRYEWRLNGGEWQRGESGTLWLREMPPGDQVVELRGYNRRLDAGAMTRVVLRMDYDPVQRVGRLLADLSLPVYETRTEAVRRLGLRGKAAEPALRAALATETDEARRWWLRAALQEIEGKQRPDKLLTTP